MDLKGTGVLIALQCDQDLYDNTQNPRYAWHAWQFARAAQVAVSDHADEAARIVIGHHRQRADVLLAQRGRHLHGGV